MYAEDGASFEPGLYVCGWLKRGPSGGWVGGWAALPTHGLPVCLLSTPQLSLANQHLKAATYPPHTHTVLAAGIIGTNLVDAEQTVDTMVQTQGSFRSVEAQQAGAAGVRALLEQRGVQVRLPGCWTACLAAGLPAWRPM